MTLAQNNLTSRKNRYASDGHSSGVEMPRLVQIQTDSFNWLIEKGFWKMLQEISPIEDVSGRRFRIKFADLDIREPAFSEEACRNKEGTYASQIYVTVQLEIMATGEIKEQPLFFGELPRMTHYGTFIINGEERVVVSQLIRAPGAYFSSETDAGTGKRLAAVKLLPYRGASLEMDISTHNVISVKVDRKRKLPATALLRALGLSNEEIIRRVGEEADAEDGVEIVEATLAKDTSSTKEEALQEIFQRLRPGEIGTAEIMETTIQRMFFDKRQYDLGEVGRYKLNGQLKLEDSIKTRTLSIDDFLALTRRLVELNGSMVADDIDHLGNRRVRAVGELIQNHLRMGFRRMEKVIRERMTTQIDPAATTPAALVNNRPVVSSSREFFGGSQLSQFMDQTNPLAELTHKRRLSALGPGGLTRERAGFDVRDVHYSHYGRICPIETPEGPNIGLLGSLATYARLNEFGFIETPYRRVRKTIKSDSSDLARRTAAEDILDAQGKVVTPAGKVITDEDAAEIRRLPVREISVKPYLIKSDKEYLSADKEEKYILGQSTTPLDSLGQIDIDSVEVRRGETFSHEIPDAVHYLEVAPTQIVSACTALIPFLEHNDAGRALMGSNMQRQAVPVILSEAPLVGTGMEEKIARDSGHIVLSKADGVVTACDSTSVTVTDGDGLEHRHNLIKFRRSNQATLINQHPIVKKGERVKKGDFLADGTATDNGELSLGQNLKVGFMSWEGFNYEDAIVISEEVVRKDLFTSVHIEKFEVESRETKLGNEEITSDIPHVAEENLKDLDEYGIVRVGAWVKRGDILVGKITPKVEQELTPEERLLRAIFGEKAKDVKDSSLRLPHGQRGKVIATRIISRDKGDTLPHGVEKRIRVWVAHTRKIQEGDKMAGRHGNKGVVSIVVPKEDMPFLEDGTPLDILLNPIGVPSRMNLGQLMEARLGWALDRLGMRSRSSVFESESDAVIEDLIAKAWFLEQSGAIDKRNLDSKAVNWDKLDAWLAERNYSRSSLWKTSKTAEGNAGVACMRIWMKEVAGVEDAYSMKKSLVKKASYQISAEKNIPMPLSGKAVVYDGKTGRRYDKPVTVGSIYMLKLNHLVEDKIHARSTGPYALVTQQPLGGKAQFGGQRFGEMEVWALEAYSAAYTLQEMLTFKSDDAKGRVKAFEAIVKGEDQFERDLPESFRVLMKELQGLCLSLETQKKEFPGDDEAEEALNIPVESTDGDVSWDDFGEDSYDPDSFSINDSFESDDDD